MAADYSLALPPRPNIVDLALKIQGPNALGAHASDSRIFLAGMFLAVFFLARIVLAKSVLARISRLSLVVLGGVIFGGKIVLEAVIEGRNVALKCSLSSNFKSILPQSRVLREREFREREGFDFTESICNKKKSD